LYQRTVIKGVDYQSKKNATVTNNGLLMADSTLIFIDKLDDYISPKQFSRLTDVERTNYFTFAMGDKVVKGIIDFEITGIKPYNIAGLESGFDDVVNIMSVNKLSDHFEIEGK